MMKKELSYALDYALKKGFQIHPNALELLERVEIKDLELTIKQIVREKSKQKRFLLNQDDLEMVEEDEVEELSQKMEKWII
ncbi:hypothetical protein LCGC14_3067950 [marine sediment metagenome]|uniref:Uncharacterized protein n=1 Tax=marine sediment metagenome TaxID=412755 RepID=A0A0F8WGV8_9ZZZZ